MYMLTTEMKIFYNEVQVPWCFRRTLGEDCSSERSNMIWVKLNDIPPGTSEIKILLSGGGPAEPTQIFDFFGYCNELVPEDLRLEGVNHIPTTDDIPCVIFDYSYWKYAGDVDAGTNAFNYYGYPTVQAGDKVEICLVKTDYVFTYGFWMSCGFIYENSAITLIFPRYTTHTFQRMLVTRRGNIAYQDGLEPHGETFTFDYNGKDFEFCYGYDDWNGGKPNTFFFISSLNEETHPENYYCYANFYEWYMDDYFDEIVLMVLSPTDVRDLDKIRNFLRGLLGHFEQYKGYYWLSTYGKVYNVKRDIHNIEVVSIERRED